MDSPPGSEEALQCDSKDHVVLETIRKTKHFSLLSSFEDLSPLLTDLEDLHLTEEEKKEAEEMDVREEEFERFVPQKLSVYQPQLSSSSEPVVNFSVFQGPSQQQQPHLHRTAPDPKLQTMQQLQGIHDKIEAMRKARQEHQRNRVQQTPPEAIREQQGISSSASAGSSPGVLPSSFSDANIGPLQRVRAIIDSVAHRK